MVRVSHVWLCAETVLKRKPRTYECGSFYVSVGRRGKSSFFLLTDAAIRLAYTPQTLLPYDIDCVDFDCVDFDFASATRSLGRSLDTATELRLKYVFKFYKHVDLILQWTFIRHTRLGIIWRMLYGSLGIGQNSLGRCSVKETNSWMVDDRLIKRKMLIIGREERG